MAELKTKKNTASVDEFIAGVGDETRREDARTVLNIMQKVTGKEPRMWGSSIVGFDEYHYRYDSGHEGDMCVIGFSPRASALTLYTLADFDGKEGLLAKLGKHKTGKGCLYIKRLSDVDGKVLEAIIREGYKWMKANNKSTD